MVATKTTASNRFKMRTLQSGTLLLLLTSAAVVAAQEPVSWTNQANVAIRGDRLEKTGGCDGCDDAGAISRQIIRSGDGAVEFRIGEDYTFWRAGLSRSNTAMRVGSIDFAVRLNGNGEADVMENGTYVGGDTEYRTGDVFRVEVVAGRVRYLKNGQVMHVSQKLPTYPLVFDVELGSLGATIADARIETRESAVATSGSDDEFQRLDRNDDGVISRREWVGTVRGFNQRDANRDGLLTRREMGLDEPAAVGTAGYGDVDEFRRLDRNGDGVISRREWQGTLRGFNQRDANRDGLLTRREMGLDESTAVGTAGYGDVEEFRRLDRNDDGVISRREWVGTLGEFNQRDANRDGLLTRREMGLDEPAAVGTAGYDDFIIVSGTEQWTDTGLTLSRGDRVTFKAEGTVKMSPDPNDTAGPAGSRRLAPDAPLRQQGAGTLIARIGDGPPISVGASRTITAPGGRLFLGVNDDYLGDNSGEFRVVVTIEPR